MNKVKAFYNRNFKFLMLLFSINPIVNIILDNKKKEVLQSNFSQFRFILTIVITLVFIYYYNNLERVKRINTEKTSFVVFAIFSLICSIFRYTFIETVIISLEGTLVFFVLMNVFINRVENRINRIKIAENKDIDKKEKLYDSRKPIKDRVLNILKEEGNSLILVDGEWGIGKTFFMNRVLEEENSILAIKVDVLLFNEKKQMINFVMEEIYKILLEKGIRSTSIRKYLSVINDGIDNKFVKGLYKVFSNEKTGDIEKNIKEDIEALKDEKLVVIVDNLERTLDGYITIEILGFLHYIYEKLGVNVVVLADSSKLRDEIRGKNNNSEDYLDKFFIEKIKIKEVKVEEILGKFLIHDKMNENYGVFNQIPLLMIELDLIRKNKNEELEKNKNEELEKNKNEVEHIKERINKMKSDYDLLVYKLSNPRTYHLIRSEFDNLKEEVLKLYHLDLDKLSNYEKTILFISIYKVIFKETFEKEDLKTNNFLRYSILYQMRTEFYTPENFFSKEKSITARIQESIIELINYSSNEIIEASNFIEKINDNDELISSKEVNEIIQIIHIYYSTLFNLNEENRDTFFNFYRVARKYLKKEYDGINLEVGEFESLIKIDRTLKIYGEESLIEFIFANRDEIGVRDDLFENKLMHSLANIYNDIINNVAMITKENEPLHSQSRGLLHIKNKMIKHNNDSNVILNVIKSIESKLNGNDLNYLEKEYLKYFITLYKIYGLKEINYSNKKEKNFEYLKKVSEKIKDIKEENIKLGNKIDEQMKFDKNIWKLQELDAEKFNYIYEILDDSIPNVITLKVNLERVKKIYEITGEYWNYMIGYRGFNDIYKEFNYGDPDFEKILKKANIDVFQNEKS